MRSLILTQILIATGAAARITHLDDKTPVCVVGAGPAGLAAAHSLESKGHDVVMFEKQAAVGGKSQVVYDNDHPDTFHPLGALIFFNETYVETLKIIEQTTVKATQQHVGPPQWVYNWTDGDISTGPAFTVEQEALLLVEVGRYETFWNTVYYPISDVGYRDPIPEELTVSVLEWCVQNDYRVLPALFNIGMVAYGYGDLRQTPMWYIFQGFHPDIVAAFAGISKTCYLIDFHEVFEQWARTLEGPIHLNAQISNIDRTGASPIITYSIEQGYSQTQTCSALVMAFPPTVAALEASNIVLTSQEQTLFSEVQLINYFSGAVSMVLPPDDLFYANSSSPLLPPPASGEPVGVLRFFAESNITTTWSWGAFGEEITLEQGRALLIETLSRINKDPNDASSQPVPIQDADVKGFMKHDYFPQVSSAALARGWYQELDSQQGRNKTFFASGLNAFESAEFAIRAGQDVVASYF